MESIQTPRNAKLQPKTSVPNQNAQNRESLLSPRFRSAAAMAGWDEETLLLATFIVEDTPERESGSKRRPRILISETSPTSSRGKRRACRQSDAPFPEINIDDCKGNEKQPAEDNKVDETAEEKRDSSEEEACSSATASLPCIDRLREELSCAICLEICFEPSSTPCGHSFCKKCLKSAADKCGKKCPKCRQLIGNGRSCTVNTVLWNTIQLLFPAEVEAKKAAAAASSAVRGRQSKQEIPNRSTSRRGHGCHHRSTSLGTESRPRRRTLGSEEEDAALAFRLQREEFMEVFQVSNEEVSESRVVQEGRNFRWASELNQPRNHLSSARARLRAMASRANDARVRGRPI
ncbi:hypothetical protein H6P81_012424 [Aristolochia fimbriata]|uniref:RING-type E3 ubiquitin transferase n=1 Tax=Aristolochia fimbriata TaxID=158543 RepID=A0AAV7EEV5_ARIFI|nr:hypothetical protein H6P81_012424 [Aristolochia fimbriata]